jgi:hypothetical protein
MIARALVGAVAAAIAMFILGFLFFATPLASFGTKSLPDAQAQSVQSVLAQNLPGTATYAIPSDTTPHQTSLYGRGPIATVHYNTNGYAVGDAATMIGGFIHMLVVGLLMAVGISGLSGHVGPFRDRMRLLVLGVLGATLFMRLGEPIWYHHDWGHAIYLFVADSVSLIAAGFIILKLLPKEQRATAPADAPAEV